VPTIQGRGSKGQGWLPLKRKIDKAGSALRPAQPPSQTSAIAGIRLPRRTSVGATASPVATSLPVATRVAEEVLCLPIFPDLGLEHVDNVVAIITAIKHNPGTKAFDPSSKGK